MDELDSVIESQDPEFDVEAVMREVRARLEARRAEAEARDLDYDAFAEGRFGTAPIAGIDVATQEALHYVSLGYDKVGVELSLTETRLPLLGAVVQRFRYALHSVILYYLNMLAVKQVRFNKAVAQSLGGMAQVVASATSADEAARMQDEIRRLEARVAVLEACLQQKCD
jgi:hypothetical protein